MFYESSSRVVPHEPLKVQETQLSILVGVVYQKNCLGTETVTILRFPFAGQQIIPFLQALKTQN